MEGFRDRLTQKLSDRHLISDEQLQAVKAYHSLGIFSLRNELLFLFYTAVLLFTSGAGILIYKNIETIGHTVLLIVLLLVTAVCFYFCFKHSPGFSKAETKFEHPLYDYLVLLATILSCIFTGYVQFQYGIFGADFGLATLVSALIAFFCAYYFDNRSALSIGITGLAAFIGITITPQAVLENNIFDHGDLSLYGIGLGVVLAGWDEYTQRSGFKKHFSLVFTTFALHLTGICCLWAMFGDFWLIYVLVLGAMGYYFYRKSYALAAVSVFVFTLVYGYLGFNVLLFKLLDMIDAYQFLSFIAILSPMYLILSIYLFIRMIKKFNKETDDGNR